MISRIGQARGRPVLFAEGRWGMITSHSSSVTSVWYRLVSRICCFRVVGVHMATPRLVSATPWNHIRLQPLNPFRNGLLEAARFAKSNAKGDIIELRDWGHEPPRA